MNEIRVFGETLEAKAAPRRRPVIGGQRPVPRIWHPTREDVNRARLELERLQLLQRLVEINQTLDPKKKD